MGRLRSVIGMALVLAGAGPAAVQAGLAAHEVLVLVNRQSMRSMEVANHFVRIRQVPSRNVIYLDLPEHVLEPKAEITPDDFTRHIWDPVQAILAERELEAQVLAWIYSVDFPIRITTDPPVSLMGMTFMRNRFPADPDRVDKGAYFSRLFAGPDKPDGEMALGASLVRYPAELGDAMPVPSMMLGFVGSRGTDTETVIRALRYGQAADRSRPSGTVYWATGEDVRAKMRAWQFPIAERELRRLGIRSETRSELPTDQPGIIGVQVGAQGLHVERVGRHLPGSMAEHLTSHAASFHLPYQTKLTDWLRAGATASAGAVTEPYTAWSKFPHARFFAHYGRGHSMLESFYLSIRSPTQILLVGEPLTRPWAAPLSMTLVALDDGPLRGEAMFAIALFPELPDVRHVYHVFLDGKKVTESSGQQTFAFDTRDVADGYHELRVVAYARGPLVHTVMDRISLRVANNGRAVRVTQPATQTEHGLYEPLQVEARAEGEPVRLELMHNARVLAESGGDAATFGLDLLQVGPGPVSLQVHAVYDDGTRVRSAPLELTIKRPAEHPALRAELPSAVKLDSEHAKLTGGTVSALGERGALFDPEAGDEHRLVLFPEPVRGLKRYAARITVPDTRVAHLQNERAGLVFGVRDADNFYYFIMDGRPSAWVFGRCRNGAMEHALERGALILRGTSQDVDLLFDGERVSAYVNGAPLAEWSVPETALEGGWGVLAARRAVQFERIRMEMEGADDHGSR